MDETKAKYNRFKSMIMKIVRPEHSHLIGKVSHLTAGEFICLLSSVESLDEVEQIFYDLTGLDESAEDDYAAEDIAKIRRYIEYFYKVSRLVVG